MPSLFLTYITMSEEATKQIRDNIAKFYDLVMEKPREVYEIFCDFFGEERVDLQGYISIEDFTEKVESEVEIISLFSPKQLKNTTTSIYEDSTLNSIEEKDAIELSRCLGQENVKDMIDWIVGHPSILVHFPKVTITNEFDRSIEITHLWAKVPIDYLGHFDYYTFTLNRSEYTYTQYISDYMHSHINGIPKSTPHSFKEPCLGRGPIKHTIQTLRERYSEDIWKLFCLELNKYVSVESIAGVPYKRLENVGNPFNYISVSPSYNRNRNNISNSVAPLLRDFITHYIKTTELKFSFDGYKYSLGISYYDFIIQVSNAFIAWYNSTPAIQKEFAVSTLYSERFLIEVQVENKRIGMMDSSKSSYNIMEVVGSKVCTFKGRDITLNIVKDTEGERNYTTLLNIALIQFIYTCIIKTINYGYSRNFRKERFVIL